ncbi:hypothetical protein SARC_11479 [Sphaeroforma arctica JP610]|uniref:ABC transporter domain-containing protein n=1 Tax=Sphaeroforma arctica JP610 TaxID=667725 RepID=A0A0L0FGV4_9EUKA|nr:hypothetical protein SARC_11479 [Sphaeroforma arctica JP610]KNC76009.1 hypothetical protein SARC_11479 [Sphaeroforma arctica JP610]|eukprot:XP_014149911.1 hypothetical protein SARC_11479 [Sphaeroforma arctica JP610]
MDEADLLGDRIAIISDGQLKCIGSSLYLKQAYGAGYHLVCTAKRGTSKIADSIDVNALTRLIMSFVPVAKLESSVGAEVTYTMPSSDAKVFPDLLKALDDYSEVEDYGLSMTTMEEVFLAANGFSNLTDDDNNGETGGALDMPEKSADGPMTDVTSKHDMYDTSAKSADSVGETAVASVEMKPVAKSGMRQKLFQPSPLKTGMALKKQQYTAMVKKRYVHSKRDKGAVLCQWVFPIIFMVLAMVLAKTIKEDFDRPPLTFNINDLDTSSVPIQNLNAGNALADSVVTQLTQEFSPTLVTTVDPTTNFTLNWINTAYTDLEATIYPGYIIQTTNPTGGDDGSQLLFVTEYFQNLALHGSAIYLNVLNNAIARVYVPGMSITTTNHPLPLTAAARNERIEEGGQELAVAIFTIFAMSFLAASFVTFVVDERRTKAKHIQFVSGVDTVSFWLATYTWDLINYLIPVTVILIIIIGFQVEYYTGSNYGAVVCLFLLFGWSVIPLMYICSFGFKVPSTALASMILFNMLLGLATSLTTFIMDQYEDLEGVSEILGWVFMCVPHYCLGRGLMDISYNHLASQVAGYVSQNDLFSGGFNYSPQSALSWNVSGKNCLFMFLEGFVFFGIVLLIEYRFFIRKKPTKVRAIVLGCAQMCMPSSGSQSCMSMQSCIYLCVSNNIRITFKLFRPPGINGAGKTTTFKMLTGDLSVTSGNAYLENYSVVSALKKARKNIGYCPQFDALIGLMTGRETLQMYARLRGIQDKEVDDSVEAIIQMLQLEKWADRQAKTYSGGNKRKLSTGIALVGTPPIVFLDEPTTGMDPAAKRFLWNTLNDVRAQGLALVLTSHSMEEVSAICTRLAIMVNGEFRCLGNQQYLKNKYGDGYALVVKVNSDADVKPIREFITTNFPTSVLKEEYARMVSYQIDVKSDNMSLSEVFKKMSDAKETLNVDDFHVSQTSLEQVFIRFAKTDAALKSSTVSLEKLCEKDVIDDDEARVATTTAAGEPFVEHSNADDKDGLEKGSSSIQKRSDGNYGNHRDLDGESDGVVNADSDDEGVSGHVV